IREPNHAGAGREDSPGVAAHPRHARPRTRGDAQGLYEGILKWILQRLRRWPREPAGRKGSYRGGRRRGARGVSRYQRVDRGAGGRSGQLLQHVDDPKRWLVRAVIGRNAKGKKQYRSEVVTGRKRDAE